jgi:hypothetical protein
MGIPSAKTMETNPCNVLQDPPSAGCHWTSQLLHSRGLQNNLHFYIPPPPITQYIIYNFKLRFWIQGSNCFRCFWQQMNT